MTWYSRGKEYNNPHNLQTENEVIEKLQLTEWPSLNQVQPKVFEDKPDIT